MPPAGPHNTRDDSRTWALAAHLSALLSLFVAKKDDPFVRRHAAEALNFNLSVMLYAIVLGIATVVLIFFVVGLALIPVLLLLGLMWLVCVCLAAARAGQGEEYRYPLTIRFVS